MRKIVDGKVYDTKTATVVCDISPNGGFGRGDFAYEETRLYKSPRGAFFLSGAGGPLTRWAVPEGQNGHRSGSGLYVIDIDEARSLCERHGTSEEFIAAFGEPEEG